MIRSFIDIYNLASSKNRVNLAVINPKKDYLFETLSQAENLGWIHAIHVNDTDDRKAAETAVSLVNEGKADLLMKGDVSTHTVLTAVLNKDSGIRTGNRLSHTAVLESPGYNRLMLMTDGGVNPTLDDNVLSSIVLNAVEIAGKLQNEHPYIALLSLIEDVNPAVPETLVMARMSEKYKDAPGFTVEGPISIDVAVSLASAEAKQIKSRISGETDIFIGPNITTINFMVKSLLGMGGAKGGGLITGAKVPIVLLSRSDNSETKLNSIALGITSL